MFYKTMKLLEELRAQRELIRQHLAWLDQKIARLEQDEPTDRPAVDDAAPKAQEPADKNTEVPATNNETPQEPEKNKEEILSGYKSLVGDEVQRAKIGCLALFVISTALFLFLLFGLPYLIK